MSRALRTSLWVSVPIIAAIGESGFVIYGIAPREMLIPDITVGVVTMSTGVAMWSRRPGNRLGPMLFLAGMGWALAGLNAYDGILFTIGWLLLPVHVSILLHVLLAYPDGRLRSHVDRVVVAVIYGNVLVHLVGTMALDPRYVGIPAVNALHVIHDRGFYELVDEQLTEYVFVGLLLAVVIILVARWRATTPTARRVYAPVVVSALLLLSTKVADATAGLIGASPAVRDAIFFWTVAAKLIVPIAFLFALLRSRIEEAAVGDLLIELGSATPRVGLRDALARTLHDPSVELVYWLPDHQRFVDAGGRRIQLPFDRSRRAVTMIERGGEPLGAVIHDPALLEQRRLLEAASKAAQLTIENERLQAEVRATLEEVRASRARIVEAGDAERQRVERNLHDGAQQRLLSLSLALRMARDRLGPRADPEVVRILDESWREANDAVAELRELAQGIHPAVLTEEGLSAAIESLTERATLPVSGDVSAERYPPPIEATAYFVVSEALANIAKYSRATRASVNVARRDGTLLVEVTDDGVGGADPSRGSGLRGLDDRVAAVGGRLEIESPAERGTRIRAVLPCA